MAQLTNRERFLAGEPFTYKTNNSAYHLEYGLGRTEIGYMSFLYSEDHLVATILKQNIQQTSVTVTVYLVTKNVNERLFFSKMIFQTLTDEQPTH